MNRGFTLLSPKVNNSRLYVCFKISQIQQQLLAHESNEAPSRTSFYRWHGEFNRGRSSLQDEFREVRPKTVVVPETIDAVRQLILQDRHVAYREIETTLGISGTSNLFALDPTQFVNRSKKAINQSDKSTLTIGSNACKSV